jgi:hypothetical protein
MGPGEAWGLSGTELIWWTRESHRIARLRAKSK